MLGIVKGGLLISLREVKDMAGITVELSSVRLPLPAHVLQSLSATSCRLLAYRRCCSR